MVDHDTGRTHVLHTTNLSVGGAQCSALTCPPDGAVLEGRLFLPLTEAGRDVDVAIPVRGRVLHREGSVFALAFEALCDADRAEVTAYLFDWLADDSWCHERASVGCAR